MEKLHYICGRKANRPVTYRNNIYEIFRIKSVRLNPPGLIPILSIKTLDNKIDEVKHGNYISRYNQAHGGSRELKKLSMVITT